LTLDIFFVVTPVFFRGNILSSFPLLLDIKVKLNS